MSNEWISVEDRLPVKTQKVRVKSDLHGVKLIDMAVAYVCPEYGGVIWEDLDGEDYLPTVTYWAEIEEPQK